MNSKTLLFNFFQEDLKEVVGVSFDEKKIFLVRLLDDFEYYEVTLENLDNKDSHMMQIAEKVSSVCNQKHWRTTKIGLCLRENEVVTFRTEIENIPQKEIPSLVRSWAKAQNEGDSTFSFIDIGDEIWMETIPSSRAKSICAAWNRFGLRLSALSAMPIDPMTKNTPFTRAEFIAEVIRNKKFPNLLKARKFPISFLKISIVISVIFLVTLAILSLKTLLVYKENFKRLENYQMIIKELQKEIELKEILDKDISELNSINKNCAAQELQMIKFNALINIGKISSEDLYLTKINCEENLLELEGASNNPESLRNYLVRVKNFITPDASLENSSTDEKGKFTFKIHVSI